MEALGGSVSSPPEKKGKRGNEKFPPENRAEGEGFEETWKSFLGLIFAPRFRKLLKAKKRGVGRITLDGKSY